MPKLHVRPPDMPPTETQVHTFTTPAQAGTNWECRFDHMVVLYTRVKMFCVGPRVGPQWTVLCQILIIVLTPFSFLCVVLNQPHMMPAAVVRVHCVSIWTPGVVPDQVHIVSGNSSRLLGPKSTLTRNTWNLARKHCV